METTQSRMMIRPPLRRLVEVEREAARTTHPRGMSWTGVAALRLDHSLHTAWSREHFRWIFERSELCL